MPAAARPFDTVAGAVPAADRPDPSYWTEYDHFMIEREARAMRNAHAWKLVGQGWQALRRRFAAIASVRGGGASPASLPQR